MKKSTLLHLRFPFSFFLLPVYLFAVASVGVVELFPTLLSFVVLHLCIYPASNGFNSWFDQDEQAIGGLKNPPKTHRQLYYYSLGLDGIGILLGLLISIEFALFMFVYGMVSKSYSHPSVRLKKRPIAGLLSVSVFQGYFIFLATIHAVGGIDMMGLLEWEWQFPALLSTVLLLGSYPMTQIYQHEEDGERGDLTLSRLLGITGTFIFTALVFTLAMGGFVYHFFFTIGPNTVVVFVVLMLPTLVFFLWWFVKVMKSQDSANHKYTMRLNMISSTCLNLFFLIYWTQNGLP